MADSISTNENKQVQVINRKDEVIINIHEKNMAVLPLDSGNDIEVVQESIAKSLKSRPSYLGFFSQPQINASNPSLMDVIRSIPGHDPFTREAFADFLRSEYASESLLFWLNVEFFKQKFGETTQKQRDFDIKKEIERELKREKKSSHNNEFQIKDVVCMNTTKLEVCLSICDDFVKVGCKNEINIPGPSREKIIEALSVYKSDADVNVHVFDEAQQEIFHLMERDNFQRFSMKSSSQNLNKSEQKYRWVMFFINFAVNIVIVYLMVHFKVPQPYAALSIIAWFGAFDYAISAHSGLCLWKAYTGDRLPYVLKWYEQRVGYIVPCNLKIEDENTRQQLRRKAKIQFLITFFIAACFMAICVSLPNMLEI